MIGTKCRIGFLQYLPKKPTKWGVKVWVLADAKSGYVCNFQIYTGREESPHTTFGLGYRVIMYLMDKLLDKATLYTVTKNFTNVLLALDILKRNTFICGTLRQDAKNMADDIKAIVLPLDREKCV